MYPVCFWNDDGGHRDCRITSTSLIKTSAFSSQASVLAPGIVLCPRIVDLCRTVVHYL